MLKMYKRMGEWVELAKSMSKMVETILDPESRKN
jgi:hypothetical protein